MDSDDDHIHDTTADISAPGLDHAVVSAPPAQVPATTTPGPMGLDPDGVLKSLCTSGPILVEVATCKVQPAAVSAPVAAAGGPAEAGE